MSAARRSLAGETATLHVINGVYHVRDKEESEGEKGGV